MGWPKSQGKRPGDVSPNRKVSCDHHAGVRGRFERIFHRRSSVMRRGETVLMSDRVLEVCRARRGLSGAQLLRVEEFSRSHQWDDAADLRFDVLGWRAVVLAGCWRGTDAAAGLLSRAA